MFIFSCLICHLSVPMSKLYEINISMYWKNRLFVGDKRDRSLNLVSPTDRTTETKRCKWQFWGAVTWLTRQQSHKAHKHSPRLHYRLFFTGTAGKVSVPLLVSQYFHGCWHNAVSSQFMDPHKTFRLLWVAVWETQRHQCVLHPDKRANGERRGEKTTLIINGRLASAWIQMHLH